MKMYLVMEICMTNENVNQPGCREPISQLKLTALESSY